MARSCLDSSKDWSENLQGELPHKSNLQKDKDMPTQKGKAFCSGQGLQFGKHNFPEAGQGFGSVYNCLFVVFFRFGCQKSIEMHRNAAWLQE